MFIIAWLVIVVLRANHVIIPPLVSHIVGWLAIAEIILYVIVIVLQILVGGLIVSNKRRMAKYFNKHLK